MSKLFVISTVQVIMNCSSKSIMKKLVGWAQLGSREKRAWTEFKKGLDNWGPDKREKAAIHFQNSIRLKSVEGIFHMRLAATLEGLGRIDEAKERFEEAIRLMPDERPPCYMMGNLLINFEELNLADNIMIEQ